MSLSLESQLDYLAEKKFWILDVDGCLYPRDEDECGYYQRLTFNIKKSFNDIVTKDLKGKNILESTKELLLSNGFKGDIDKIDGQGEAFIPFVRAIKQNYPEDFYKYMNIVYGDSYHMITRNAGISYAFKKAESRGVDINFYTNGPSAKNIGEFSHIQKILALHGVDDADINRYRTKTYDLLDAVIAGEGKPVENSMRTFLNFAGIDNTDQTVMFDDSIENLKTAADFGIMPVWTWTSDEEPSKKALEIAEEIGAIRVRDTAPALIQIAARI